MIYISKRTLGQTLEQDTSGNFISTHNGLSTLIDTFSYPVKVDFTYLDSTWTNCKL
jgi:hypothetical protein